MNNGDENNTLTLLRQWKVALLLQRYNAKMENKISLKETRLINSHKNI